MGAAPHERDFNPEGNGGGIAQIPRPWGVAPTGHNLHSALNAVNMLNACGLFFGCRNLM